MVKIGVISDTHGLLRPEAVAALRGSDLILHTGDVGAPEILDQLHEVAPVTAVRGNVDRADWVRARKLASSELVEVDDVSIYVLHSLDELDLKPEAAGIKVVVYGHSHKPSQKTKNGVLYFNPGSAGPRRFKLPVSVGRLVVEGGVVRGEIVELEGE
jgi:putative phosphoesterase